MMKTSKTIKIFFLVSIIFTLLFPLLASAGLADEIGLWLTDRGYVVQEKGELELLVPESGMRFEVKNLARLVKGWNQLELILLHEDTVYAETSLRVFLKDVPASAAAADRPAARDQSRSKPLVKPGDTVTILFNSSGLLIRSTGKVLRSAGPGETTDVLNIPFNTVVKVVVRDSKNVVMK